MLAGACISIGPLLVTVVVTETGLGFGTTRLLGGPSFRLGLILVVVAGAEPLTGNDRIAMAWASGLVGTHEVVRNRLLVCFGNVVGCLATVLLVLSNAVAALGDGAVGETAIRIARASGIHRGAISRGATLPP